MPKPLPAPAPDRSVNYTTTENTDTNGGRGRWPTNDVWAARPLGVGSPSIRSCPWDKAHWTRRPPGFIPGRRGGPENCCQPNCSPAGRGSPLRSRSSNHSHRTAV